MSGISSPFVVETITKPESIHLADFFEVIALKEPLDPSLLRANKTREQIADAIVGKVLAWGMWVGVAERKWE